ncbi:hypothetical protein C8F04DRAFT_1048508 [Mycena alexandri]|uniref:Cupin type-2 domain-containing protein n=1 Tax=Mycena alexandri TaxID=1745969 RepID=A0AAD6S3J5_9AGAR|nr:hypothetical protein C8F04DRAFT_1403778 [Mycena alexandri]KAJ7022976.1 hypothetical protein C8F04DRAFT_1048508 [Mycena alexandri]
MSSIKAPFPPVRRVVTGHTSAGKSTVIADTVELARPWGNETVHRVHDLHYTEGSPAIIDTEIAKGKWVDEIKMHPELVSGMGSTFRCWDVPPGDVSPAHRTVTLDYAIVFKGTVILELEEGERVTLNEGDTVVQRGTMHTWRNETTEWAKVYFVMLGAQPIEIEGKKLEEELHHVE